MRVAIYFNEKRNSLCFVPQCTRPTPIKPYLLLLR